MKSDQSKKTINYTVLIIHEFNHGWNVFLKMFSSACMIFKRDSSMLFRPDFKDLWKSIAVLTKLPGSKSRIT